MAKTRQQKEKTVVTLIDKFNRAKSVIFADYKGIKTSELDNLRKKLDDLGAEITVAKNTLIELALKLARGDAAPSGGSGAGPRAILEGPTVVMFAYDDAITPIKILVKAIKDYQKGSIKSGFLGTDFLDPAYIVHLASLPSKLELQGKVVGLLLAPLSGMVGVLNANLRNLVYALDQVRRQRGGE